ncbi:MAG: hypothetical protein ACW96M_07215 [Candidatus Thorarchaeota archaeon]|jgi:hypothetical protein
MRLSKFRLFGVVGFLITCVAWAGDPWKEKPFQEWTADDVQKLLTDSPWALKAKSQKMGTKVVTYQPPSYATTTSATTVCARSNGCGMGKVAPPKTVIRTPPPTGETISTVIESHKFELLWLSALTVRQGLVRRRMLEGTITAKEGEKLLSNGPGHYVLALAGPDIYTLALIPDEEIQTASLHTRKGKKIIPVQQVFRGKSQSGALAQILFYFPRAWDGKATLEPDETKVTFLLETRVGKLEAKFHLKKMVRDGAPDI